MEIICHAKDSVYIVMHQVLTNLHTCLIKTGAIKGITLGG
jgi:hypothetical protein